MRSGLEELVYTGAVKRRRSFSEVVSCTIERLRHRSGYWALRLLIQTGGVVVLKKGPVCAYAMLQPVIDLLSYGEPYSPSRQDTPGRAEAFV